MLKNEKGVSLLEVLASTVILSLVIITFINVSNFGLITNKKSDRSSEAMRVAEEQLNIAREYVKTSKTLPSNLTPTVSNGFTVSIQSTTPNVASPPTSYNTTSFGTQHVSLQAIVLLSSIPKIMTVTVSWDG